MTSEKLQQMVDTARAKIPAGMSRSGHWPIIRGEHLKQNPLCAVCGGDRKAEVHHIRPFHLHPDLELDPTNLITLCEDDDDGVNCHLFFGHLGSFRSFNADVVADAATWREKVAGRPKGETP